MPDESLPIDEPRGSGSPAQGSILYLDGVTVSFDGFKALNALSLVIAPGELRTVIGPNGAGKTTMMDVITGKTRPDAGDVLFDGHVDLTRLDEAAIANLGIGRKFQKPTVFEKLSLFDNLELALKGPRGTLATLFFTLSGEAKDRIGQVLTLVGLTDKAKLPAGQLSHGEKQWLEIGMLLMQDQRLLLLDEPVAGLTDAETEATAALILDLSRDRSLGERSLVVVEHDMEFVRSLAAKVTVLHEGSVLAEGSIDAVQSNPRVVEVYLGR
ncbi:urea ABC transporter ATP-binding protein UrtD [Telmatospirillum siberiense]|uniref:Urea ABC transporter ATP-binding protein UrtD n=1 Tax=Telmatospirillum siberiense TaxID=382514 RepID=A0A2N3PT89_9PROT|nr:urea ABC transporter ATP-binding protein UrtD [Telmatospirillum siberiense]PKU23623.1 urea ABC transporter ATP-binding protein UrtD [Telmatospirillum siberiense]